MDLCVGNDRFRSRLVGSDIVELLSICILATVAFAGGLRADSAAEEARFISNPRQLIYDGKRSGEGYFSKDGKALIFQSEREEGNPFYQIYLLDLETGDVLRISSGVGKTTCGFLRPDGQQGIFASTHLDPKAIEKQRLELEFRASGKQRRYSWDYDENMDIFAVELDGGARHRLTDAPGYDAEGSFSPDGRQIVFTSLRDTFPLEKLSPEDRKRFEVDPAHFGEIYLMNSDGSDQRRLTHAPGYDGGPFFSPDGQRITWRRFDPKGMNADIYTMKLDGSDVLRVTDFQSISWAPFYHPSGEYVIFTSNKFGFSNFELFIVDSEGKREPIRVTFTDGFDGLPVFAPDGRKLSWASGRPEDGSPQIFIADWNHEAAQGELARAPLRNAIGH
jgi:Tol biopolymer transport system component